MTPTDPLLQILFVCWLVMIWLDDDFEKRPT